MNLKSLYQIMMVVGFILSQTPAWSVATTTLCKDVISKQESQKGIPQDLLKAIAKVESGISPWAVNAHGRAHMFPSKEAAVSYVKPIG